MRALLIVILALCGIAGAQTSTPMPDAPVRMHRILTSGYSNANITLYPITQNGQEFYNFSLINPATGNYGCPDMAVWDSTIAWDSGNDTVGLSAAFYTWLETDYVPRAEMETDWAQATDMATVAFSGDYDDLSDKPTLFSGSWGDLTGKPSTFAPSSHTHPWSDIMSAPTTLAGYGITDGATDTELSSGLSTKLTIPAGSAAQYVTGQGLLATSPTNLSEFTNGPGFITSSALSGYLTSATAAATYSDLGHAHTFASLTSKPATLSGYGITDAYPLAGNPSGFLTVEVDASTTNEIELPSMSGQSGKLLSNNGSAATWISPAPARVITNGTGRSIVTTTSSTGFLPDATQDALVSFDIDLSSTATIGGSSAVSVFLETADTNSTTPGDWTSIGKVSNGQTITLAIALQSAQSSTATLSKVIPAGKYARLRSTISGTASATIAYSQETKL